MGRGAPSPVFARDAIMDFIAYGSERTEIRALQLVGWIGLSRSKFYSWRDRYGKANEHNALVPRDHWLEPWEKVAIINFHHQYPLEGYRRLTFMEHWHVDIYLSSGFR